MTLKQRIRHLLDGLDKGTWLTAPEIRERLPGVTYGSLASSLTHMMHGETVIRRGTHGSFEYRPGERPVNATKSGRKPRIRTGFAHLARLERDDPAEWARITEGGKL